MLVKMYIYFLLECLPPSCKRNYGFIRLYKAVPLHTMDAQGEEEV
jgi:hypothetical protein